ncbi:Uncharacterised protein [Mycobacteroides abscessus subsp. massiliense]|nr:Uncharacterised protein [Mycobacteroides abscessus subsp. massiliense]
MVVRAVMSARTGTVLISKPTIDSAPATSIGRPDTTVPKATSCWPVNAVSSSAQAPCSTVLTVVCCDRANSPTARVVYAGTRYIRIPRCPGTDFCDGATRVGVWKPDSASPHAACAAA